MRPCLLYKLSIQSLLLIGIGLIDLISTIVLLELGIVTEANPLMRSLLPYGWTAFISFKCFTLLTYIAVITWYRQRRPRAGVIVENFTIAAYLCIYVTCFAAVNF